jgi:ribosome-associated protein
VNYLELAKVAAKAATEKKAKRLVLLDLKGASDLCDYQFICSADNEKQTGAIASAIEDAIRTNLGVKPSATEGKTNGHWILLDYGPVNIHIFYDYLRDYYALEELWPKASFIDIEKS